MSNLVKTLLIIVIVAVVVTAGSVLYTWPHWWVRVGTAEAHPAGPQTKVTVYKSSEENLLFEVEEDSLVHLYIFYPATKRIGLPNLGQFIFLPRVIYSKDIPVPVVDADSRVKVETNLNVVVENDTLQFTHDGQRRIVANLKNY